MKVVVVMVSTKMSQVVDKLDTNKFLQLSSVDVFIIAVILN